MTPRTLDDGIGTIADHLTFPGCRAPTNKPPVVAGEGAAADNAAPVTAAEGWRDCAEQLGHARARLRDMQDAMRRTLTDAQLAAVVADYRRRQRQRGVVEAELARTVEG